MRETASFSATANGHSLTKARRALADSRTEFWLYCLYWLIPSGKFQAQVLIVSVSFTLLCVKVTETRSHVEDSKHPSSTVTNTAKSHQSSFPSATGNALQHQHQALLPHHQQQQSSVCTEGSYPQQILLKSGNKAKNEIIELTAGDINARHLSTLQTRTSRKCAVKTSKPFSFKHCLF